MATDRKTNGKNAYATPATYLKSIWADIPDELFVDFQQLNPYKGLFHFTYQDRDNYFGREKESKEIVQIVKESRFFTLLGASGSGKSSLLFAGILPLIKEKRVAILDFRPQDRPFRNLANIFIKALYSDRLMQIEKKEELTNKLLDGTIKLDDLTEEYFENQKIEKLYIIIDQFEELFTLTKDKKIKNLFLDQLLQLVESNLNVTLIISLRADFLSFASYSEPFNQTINQNPKIILGLMNEESLKRAIELPAKNLGVRFEKGLIERILEEISKEAGQLPLLEFALEQFWQKMSSRVIAHKSLDEMGSISHAISYHADRVYEKYPNKEAVRRIFLKLVNSGSGTEDTRRVAKFEDFDKSDRDTITLLATDRLVITTENSVEVVHEALIREWSVLKAWIEEHREFLEWEKRTRIDLEFYKDNGEKEEDLLRDGKLLRAKEFLESYEREVSGEFRGVIERSVKRDKQIRFRKIIAFVSVFVVIVSFAFYGFWQKSVAEKQKLILIEKEYKSEELNKKLLTTIQLFFASGLDITTNTKKLTDEKIYQLIVDLFYKSRKQEILELVKYSYNNLGNIYFQKNKSKALDYYLKCIEIGKGTSNAYYHLGFIYYSKGEYNKAITFFNQLIKFFPNEQELYTSLYNKLGMSYLLLGVEDYNLSISTDIFEKAISSFEQVIPEWDNSYDINNLYNAYLIQSEIYSYQKLYNKEIEMYQKAIVINPKDYEIYYNMGNTYSKEKEYDKAIKAYTESIVINPKYDGTYVNLFELQLTKKQPFDQLLESKYRELFQNKKESFIQYEMLKIFQDIVNGKDSKIESWKQKYVNVSLGGWNFDILYEWIDGFEEGEIKARLEEALGVFEGHR